MVKKNKKQKTKNLSANAGDTGSILGQEDTLETLATHSSIPAWDIPLAVKPSGLQYMGLKRIQLNLRVETTTILSSRKKKILPPTSHTHTYTLIRDCSNPTNELADSSSKYGENLHTLDSQLPPMDSLVITAPALSLLFPITASSPALFSEFAYSLP